MVAKLYTNKSYLHKRYKIQRKTINEIAEECHTSHQTIYRWLILHGIIKDGKRN